MAEKREVVLTKLASEHIHSIYTHLLEEGATREAEELMNDFLDIVFGEILSAKTRRQILKHHPQKKQSKKQTSTHLQYRTLNAVLVREKGVNG